MSADIQDLTKITVAKSDQLNADDLIGGAITVNITGIRLSGNSDQPLIIDIDGGHRPYKPCKSMTRLLIFCWGKDGNQYVGRRMTLYRDPTVKWAGEEVGGIRISHLSNIDKSMSVALTMTRGKRKPYTVEPLRVPDYPQAEFDKNLPAWDKAIKEGKATADEVIAKVQQKGLLTTAMKSAIIACQPEPESDIPDATGNDLPDL